MLLDLATASVDDVGDLPVSVGGDDAPADDFLEDDDCAVVVVVADDDISDALASLFPPDPLDGATGAVVDDNLSDNVDSVDRSFSFPLLNSIFFNSFSFFSEDDDESLAWRSNILVAEDDSSEAFQKGLGCSVILVAVDEGCGSRCSLMKLLVVLFAVWCILGLLARGGAGNTIPMGLGPPSARGNVHCTGSLMCTGCTGCTQWTP